MTKHYLWRCLVDQKLVLIKVLKIPSEISKLRMEVLDLSNNDKISINHLLESYINHFNF